MIQTVTGEISKKEISGNALIHEHICCVSNDMLHAFGKRWLDKEELLRHAAKILTDMKNKYSLDLLVDATPIDLGRDVKLLKRISELTGVKIVASSGLYMYSSMVTLSNVEEDIADWFYDECVRGMENSEILPGILKCAADNSNIAEENEKRIGAMARVQAKTGLPIYLHTLHQGDSAIKALKIMLSRGADPKKIIIGHFDDTFTYDYARIFLDQGCRISIDRCNYKETYAEQVAKMLIILHEAGYGEQLLLSNDACLYSDFCRPGSKWVDSENLKSSIAYAFEEVKNKFISFGANIGDYEKMISKNVLEAIDT